MKQKILILLLAVMYLSSCKKDSVLPANIQTQINQNAISSSAVSNQGSASVNTVEYMSLQLAKDATNTDETIIAFKPGVQTKYNNNADAIYLQGFGMVSLSSLSSDNVALSINALPLPKTSVSIGLVVNAKTDGIYKLNMTAINAIPGIFEIWLRDNYKKDSLDFRHNSSYSFNIYKADTNTYGSHRFSLVVRENAELAIHLLSFKAEKATGGAGVSWLTENEANYTSFTVQRSLDNGQTYTDVSSLVSAGSGTYSFLDKTPVSGTDDYRLKIQDLNGTISYSKFISLVF